MLLQPYSAPYSQLPDASTTPPSPDACAGKKVVSIAAGHSHSAALTDQGELYMWGMKVYLEPQLLKVSKQGALAVHS